MLQSVAQVNPHRHATHTPIDILLLFVIFCITFINFILLLICQSVNTYEQPISTEYLLCLFGEINSNQGMYLSMLIQKIILLLDNNLIYIR